jgi:hypothetical protein
MLDPHLAYLEARLAAGCENAMALWRELRDREFSGNSRQVRRWLTERRSAPKTTPTAWRRDRTASSGGAAGSPLPSPTWLAWLLVQPPTKLAAAEAAVVARIAQDREAALVAGLARRFADLVRRCSSTTRDEKIKPLARLDAWVAKAR